MSGALFPRLSRREFTIAGLASFLATGSVPGWAEDARLANRLDADARMDIFDLFARYAWAFDCNDVKAYTETFAPDGVIVDGAGREYKGHAAIAAYIQTFLDRYGPDYLRQHHNDHLRFFGEGDACRVYSYWAIFDRRMGKEPGVRNMGGYISDCVKVNGVWLLRRRAGISWRGGGLPWKA